MLKFRIGEPILVRFVLIIKEMEQNLWNNGKKDMIFYFFKKKQYISFKILDINK